MNIEQQVEVVKVLKASREKISKPEAWIKGGFARDSEGNYVNSTDEHAVCFCSLGAINSVTGLWSNERHGATVAIEDVIGDFSIPSFNDADSTTHEDILRVWDKAIAAAEKKLVALNLERLIQAVDDQPEDKFDLSSFRIDKKDANNVCGTLFCTVGLACTLPEFQSVGFHLVLRDNEYDREVEQKVYIAKVGDVAVCSGSADPTFGEGSFERLFATRDSGVLDADHPEAVWGIDDEWFEIDDSVTDKQLALWRLRKQLAIYKGEQK